MEVDFLSELNESQRAAVEHCSGPSLVIAGAGSGKTRVLTYKIAYLLRQGYKPWNILALTFTNKAANEMRERIEKLVNERDARVLWMGTFHSIFARILRIECENIGYRGDFTIYDAQDAQNLIRQIIKEKGLDDKKYKPAMVASHISEAKNAMMGASQYMQDIHMMHRDQMQQVSQTGNIFSTYQQRLRTSNAMDFDDLLLNTFRLLKSNPEVRQKYQERFQYVLVDEYQDTNRVQHEIVKLLTETNQRVCVVGDDAQSIYSFRGAVIDNILEFQHLYPQTQVFKLERNYRSTQTIVSAAGSLIRHNRHQIEKDVYSKNDPGEPIDVLTAYSDKEEASIVARSILQLRVKENLEWSSFAILYRTNSQSRTFEEEFRQKRIPYRIVGGFSFFQRKEVKDAVAYLRLAVNQRDEASLRRVINVPARGIGATTLTHLGSAATVNSVSMWEVLCNPARYASELNAGTCGRLSRFAQMIVTASQMAQEQNAFEVANYIIKESGLWNSIFQGTTPEDISSQQYMQELMDAIAAYVQEHIEAGEPTTLTHYLQDISLLSDQDEGEADTSERVTLMTVHSAKGLEFPVVFTVGMEEGLFPSERSTSERDMEEERRLFYVALTRAMKRVFITWSRTRMRYGQFNNCTRSRFIAEIDSRYLRQPKALGKSLLGGSSAGAQRPASPSFFQPAAKPQPQPLPQSVSNSKRLRSVSSVTSSHTASAPLPAAASGVKVGSRINHARFGMGVVRAIEGTGLDTKITVVFENLGTKQLLLRFAKFEIVE